MKNLEKYLSSHMVVALIIHEKKVASFDQLMKKMPKDRQDTYSEIWLKSQVAALLDAGIIEGCWLKDKGGKWIRWFNISSVSKKTMAELYQLVHPTKHLKR